MRGLFEKDIRIIKNQKKMMLIFAGMGVLLLLSGVEISFILPYMASVMTSVAISTISYYRFVSAWISHGVIQCVDVKKG